MLWKQQLVVQHYQVEIEEYLLMMLMEEAQDEIEWIVKDFEWILMESVYDDYYDEMKILM